MLFFANFAASILNYPVLQDCDYYSTYNYSCAKVPEGMVYSYGSLKCSDESQVIDLTSGGFKCANYTSGTKILDDTAVVNDNQTGLSTNIIIFFDKSNKYTAQLYDDYATQLDDSIKACLSNNTLYYQPCQFVATACALSSYYPNSPACTAYHKIPTTKETTFEYKYWPANRPFIEYGVQASKVVDEHIINTSFAKEEELNIVLARYSLNGTFLGFTSLTNQFDKCTERRDVNEMWRLFGTGYKSNCELNIADLIDSQSTDVYDPFLIQTVSGKQILRPIPVNIISYRDAQEVAVNQRKVERRKRLFRRFFALDNYTNPIYIQVLTEMSIKFEHFNDTAEDRIPVISATYTTVARSDLERNYLPIYLDNTKTIYHSYSFHIEFVTQLSSFWKAALIVLIVLGVLCILLWLYRGVVTVKRYGSEGIDFRVIAALIAEACNIGAWYLFTMAFVFSFAIFCAYKWTPSSPYTILGDDFSVLKPFIWVAFVLSFIGLLLKYGLMLTSETFLIDWEPRRPSAPVSAWRRILIGNEFLKLHTKREYSIPFTVVAMVFIFGGFKVDYLQYVLPSSDLINSGISYGVLRFAIMTFVYILLLIFQFIVTRIIWRLVDSPYEDFVKLCSTANISVFQMLSPSWVVYVNGRSLKPSDEGNLVFLQSLTETEKGAINIKPLAEGRNEAVFEGFLAPKFREPLFQAYERIVDMHHSRPKNLKRANTPLISLEAMSAFDQLNVFLQRFFAAEGRDRDFDVWKTPFGYRLSRMPPDPPERSLFYAEQPNSLRKAIDGYGEWLLALFDLLLFVCVDYETMNTPIAAFVTLIIDAVLMAAWRCATRRNISRKALIDDRFIIN